MKRKIIKDTLSLVLITLCAVLCLSVVFEITKEPIAAAAEQEKQDSYRAVFEDAASFEAVPTEEWADPAPAVCTVSEALYALDEKGEKLGCVLSVTSPNGYGGDVTLSIGIAADGTITGVKVTAMNETVGLGAKCTDENWVAQFKGIRASAIRYTKSGKTAPDEIDAISSATRTTKAVTEAVNYALSRASAVFGYGALVKTN